MYIVLKKSGMVGLTRREAKWGIISDLDALTTNEIVLGDVEVYELKNRVDIALERSVTFTEV